MAEIKSVGVLGAGLMGHGIAQVAAQAGYDVVLREVDDDRLAAGHREDREAARAARSRRASSSRPTPTRCAAGSRRRPTTRAGRLRPGDRGDHREPRPQARDVARARRDRQARGAWLATNTSSLAVVDQAAVTSRPDRFLGLHFFNPAQVMPLVEVIRAVTTSDEAFQAGLDFGAKLGKQTVQTRGHGRLHRQPALVPYLLDAIRAYEEGVGSIAEIDDAMKAGAGHPMGPLTLRTSSGSTRWARSATCSSTSSASAASPARRCCARCSPRAGTGASPGIGFYDYSGEKPVPNPGI